VCVLFYHSLYDTNDIPHDDTNDYPAHITTVDYYQDVVERSCDNIIAPSSSGCRKDTATGAAGRSISMAAAHVQ